MRYAITDIETGLLSTSPSTADTDASSPAYSADASSPAYSALDPFPNPGGHHIVMEPSVTTNGANSAPHAAKSAPNAVDSPTNANAVNYPPIETELRSMVIRIDGSTLWIIVGLVLGTWLVGTMLRQMNEHWSRLEDILKAAVGDIA